MYFNNRLDLSFFYRAFVFLLVPFVFYSKQSFFYRNFKYTIKCLLFYRFSDFCIKMVLLTYQNRDLNPYLSMKKGMITSIIPMLLKWCQWSDSNRHTLIRYWILSPARLPFHHTGKIKHNYYKSFLSF